MRSLPFGRFLALLALTPLSLRAWQHDTPPHAQKVAKVCVATVANASTTSAFVERMTVRLANSLGENKVDAVKMDSRTTTQRKLQPTRENGEESRKKECDYILLTQIVDPRRILSNRGYRRSQLAAECPAWMQAILVRSPEKTCKLALRCFSLADSNRCWIRFFMTDPPQMCQIRWKWPWIARQTMLVPN